MNTVTVAESRFSPRRSADFITDNRGTVKHVPKIDKHGDKRAAGSFAYLHYGTVTRPLAARAFMDRLILGLTTLSQISAFKSMAPPGFLLALLVHPPSLSPPAASVEGALRFKMSPALKVMGNVASCVGSSS